MHALSWFTQHLEALEYSASDPPSCFHLLQVTCTLALLTIFWTGHIKIFSDFFTIKTKGWSLSAQLNGIKITLTFCLSRMLNKGEVRILCFEVIKNQKSGCPMLRLSAFFFPGCMETSWYSNIEKPGNIYRY